MTRVRRCALLALVLLAACQHGQAGRAAGDVLRAELLRMQDEDQAVRERVPGSLEEIQALGEEMTALSVRHSRRMKQIVRRHGWPTRSLVGEEGARAAWLLVQHADHDPAFQLRVLGMMEPLVARGEAKASHVAYLWDRTHEPQRYGTQGTCVAQGVWAPRAIEAPEQVDARRAEAGILPARLADYVSMMSGICQDREDLAPAA